MFLFDWCNAAEAATPIIKTYVSNYKHQSHFKNSKCGIIARINVLYGNRPLLVFIPSFELENNIDFEKKLNESWELNKHLNHMILSYLEP